MPSWNAVLQQMTEFQQQSPIDIIRRRYLKSLFKKQTEILYLIILDG